MTYVVAYNLCGSNEYTVRFEQVVAQVNQIVNCKCCGLMYANPRTRKVDNVLIETYAPEFVLSAIVNQDSQRLEKEALQVKYYEKPQLFFTNIIPKKVS